MNSRQWIKVKGLFDPASQLEGEEREKFLVLECGEEEEVLAELRSLLDDSAKATSFLEGGAIGEVAEIAAKAGSGYGLETGEFLGHFKIISRIGRGGMGEIYLANDTKLNRRIAIKLLREELGGDPEKLNRFLQEMHAASSLNHPNILTVHESGRKDERRYIVTEFVEGSTLRDFLLEQGRIPVAETLDITVQVAEALSAAHEAGIIHRDIKPENLMIRNDGYVKVLDFGLAKLARGVDTSMFSLGNRTLPKVDTESGMLLGTVAYMSPEQASGKETDERTDIWALGVVLYEMLAGKLPFEGKTMAHRIMAIVDDEPDQLTDVPDELARIVHKALSKDADTRYRTVKDLLTDLRPLSRGLAPEPGFWRSTMGDTIALVETGDVTETKAAIGDGLRDTDEDRERARSTHVSTAQRLMNFANEHKTFAGLALLVLVPLIAIAGYYSYLFYLSATVPPPLTDKDIILITDFDNKTGEEDFDGALRQGLTIALEQSPFLSIFPDAEAHETLKLMKRDPDAKITRELAREICQRNGLKALIAGSIVRFDRAYTLTLEAVNAETGEVFARTQTSAAGKDKIIEAVSKGATEIREKLGESLAQIEKFDKPLPKATTSSLEALRLFSLAVEMRAGGNFAEVIRLLERAVEIDPEFARGHLTLFNQYRTTSQTEQAFESLKKAYALREKVSEMERVVIDGKYYAELLGDSHKGIEVLQAGAQMFPRNLEIAKLLAHEYSKNGELEKALSQAERMGELTRGKRGYWDRAKILTLLGRYKDAKDDLERARQKGIDSADLGVHRSSIAFIEGDSAGLERELKLFEDGSLGWYAEERRAMIAAYRGQFRKSEEHTRKAVALRIQSGVGDAEAVAWVLQWNIFFQALAGECLEVKSLIRESPIGPSHFEKMMYRPTSLALCKEDAQAKLLVDRAKAKYPESTNVHRVWVPVIDALFALENGEPLAALEKLEGLRKYERRSWPGMQFLPQSLRAKAYHLLGNHRMEEAEYERILANRGQNKFSPLFPLAQLGKARITKSKKEYEKFFEMWKDADEDLPDLIAAKKEYAALS